MSDQFSHYISVFARLNGRHLSLCSLHPCWRLAFFHHCKHGQLTIPLPITLEMGKMNNQLLHFPSYLINKYRWCGKLGKWNFRAPKFKKLSGRACPSTPLVWSVFDGLTFLPARTHWKSHATALPSIRSALNVVWCEKREHRIWDVWPGRLSCD